VRDPRTGQVAYQRQLYGVWQPTVAGDAPAWKVCGVYADPAGAVSSEARQADRGRVVTSPPAFARDHAT